MRRHSEENILGGWGWEGHGHRRNWMMRWRVGGEGGGTCKDQLMLGLVEDFCLDFREAGAAL